MLVSDRMDSASESVSWLSPGGLGKVRDNFLCFYTLPRIFVFSNDLGTLRNPFVSVLGSSTTSE